MAVLGQNNMYFLNCHKKSVQYPDNCMDIWKHYLVWPQFCFHFKLLSARLANIFCPADTGRNFIWITEPDRTFFTLGVMGCYGAKISLTSGKSNFDEVYYFIVLKPEEDNHKTKIQV